MSNTEKKIKNYNIIKQIGQGAFGSVFKVTNKDNNNIYALKQIFIKDLNQEQIENLKNEVNILTKIKNDNIVKYYESFIEKDKLNIIMEFCEGLDLKKYLNKFKEKKEHLSESLIYDFIIHLCLGLKAIHDKNIIHRDLKPENIFLDKNNKIKIGDFGISIILNNTRYAQSQRGTHNYMAPEIWKCEKYNNKVDIWALGCIIYELCTFNYCFDDKAIIPLYNKIINENHKKIDLNIYKPELQNLIDLMLKINYKERPDIEEVYKLVFQLRKTNEIKLIIEIGENDINEDIYLFGKNYYSNTNDIVLTHEILPELNEYNTELFINEKKYKYKKFFKFSEKGIYNIKIKLNIKINDFSHMFEGCQNITNIDLSFLDTQNVTNMSYMFSYCYDLKNLNLSFFETKNVTNMSYMFCSCENIKDLDLSSFDTKNVNDMSYMFSGCHNLKNLNLSSFDTHNVTSMDCMFEACYNLTSLELLHFNTKKVRFMTKMFDSCENLKILNLKSFEIENSVSFLCVFKACKNLEEIDLSSLDIKKVNSMKYMIEGCENLKKIIFNKNYKNLDLSEIIKKNHYIFNENFEIIYK